MFCSDKLDDDSTMLTSAWSPLSLPSTSSSLFCLRLGIDDFHLVFSGLVAPIGLYYTSIIKIIIMIINYDDYHDYDDFGDGMRIVIDKLMFRKFAHYLVYSDDAMVRLKQIFFSGSV